jgi:hypothetical protein
LARRLSVASNVLYCLAAATRVNLKGWRLSRASSAGTSPPDCGTLNSAELSIQQPIRSPTAMGNGRRKGPTKSLLLALFGHQTLRSFHAETSNTYLERPKFPKMKKIK